MCLGLSFSAFTCKSSLFLQLAHHTPSPKLFPWFVSDVTPPDFADLFDSLLSPFFFSTAQSLQPSFDSQFHLKTMVTRWKSHLASGSFELSVPEETQLGATNVIADFWTEPWPYWNMKERAGELYETLRSSGLVIFKVRCKLWFNVPWFHAQHQSLKGDLKWVWSWLRSLSNNNIYAYGSSYRKYAEHRFTLTKIW